MYKILCFGLFLIGSLLMSALTLNVNLLSNAMAQGYDIYRDNGYYSQYPTDDKKYECRTGPFEGFFVSSVEFCKHVKFDDNKKIIEIIEQCHKVQQVHKVHPVLTEQQEVQQVHQAHKAQQVLMEPMEQQEQQVQPARQVLSQVHKVYQELMEQWN